MKWLGFDTETHANLHETPTPPMVCGQFCAGKNVKLLLRDPALDFLEEKLDDDEWGIVGHHIAFDLGVAINERLSLRAKVFRAYRMGRIKCTMTRQRLLNIREGSIEYSRFGKRFAKADYSLAGLSQLYLGVKLDKKGDDHVRKRYHEVDGIPVDQWPEDFRKYAEDDARYTYAVFKKQYQTYGLDTSPDERFQTKIAWDLHLEAITGVYVNQESLGKVEEALLEEQKDLQRILAREGFLKQKYKTMPERGFSANLKNIRESIESILRKDTPRTKKGAVSTASDTIVKAATVVAPDDKDHVFLKYNQYKANEKILGYVKTMKSPSGWIYSRPNVLVATGRTSWAKPNFQQVPRKAGLRECVEAPEGQLIISCDYDSLELRALAQVLLTLCGRSHLARRYQEDPDFDPHTDFAAGLLGISYEEGLRRKKAEDPVFLDMRQMCKAANFGYPGGMGVKKFPLYAYKSYGVVISERQSQELKDGWFKKNPEMRQYFNLINAAKGGSFTQLVSGRVRGNIGFCDGANSGFQGLAADGAKAGLDLITNECYLDRNSDLFGSRPFIFVHDENLLYTAEKNAHLAAKRTEELMIGGMKRFIKDVPIRCTAALSKIWSKNAKPVYNDEGILVPWTS